MTLDLLPLGQEAVITAVGGGGALRCRLLDMGLPCGWRKPPHWEIPSNCGCGATHSPCGRRTLETSRWRWHSHDLRSGRQPKLR